MVKLATNGPSLAVLIGGCVIAGTLGANVLVAGSGDFRYRVVAILGLFIFGFVAVTRRGVPVTSRAVAIAGVAGILAGFGPPVVFMLWPPVPASNAWALVAVAAALTATAATVSRTGDRLITALLCGLLAAVIAALLIEPTVAAMVTFGPARWVPQLPTNALLLPDTQLVERREAANDSYLWVPVLGGGLALVMGAVSLLVRRRVRTTTSPQPADGPQLIELGEL